MSAGETETVVTTGAHDLITDQRPRCYRCGRVLAACLTRPWELRCRRCGAPNRRSGSPEDQDRSTAPPPDSTIS